MAMRDNGQTKLSIQGWPQFAFRDLLTDLRRLPFAVLLVAYLVLALAYSLVTPIYEPTDEIRHVRYVRHLTTYRSLPIQSADGPRAQSHHPPLYYALGALVSWWVPVEQDVYYEPPRNPHWTNQYEEVSADNKNQYIYDWGERFPPQGITLAVYAIRWMTVLIGATAVWLTYRIGRRISPGRPVIALGAAALVAFNPQFLHLSGAVNNDVPAAAWGAGILLVCIRLIHRGPDTRTDVTLGVLFGLALLTKFHLLVLGVPIMLAYAISAGLSRDWRSLLQGGAIILGLAALISGWWFWRNYTLYGDPTGMRKVNELWAGRSASGNWWAVRQGLPHLWSSLWGRFGYGQIPLHRPVYGGLLGLCGLGMTGYLVPRRRTLPIAELVTLSVTAVAFVAAVFYYILIQPAGPMGRFLFPGLPAFAVLVTLGLTRLVPSQMVHSLGLGVSVGAAALAVYALTAVLAPAYMPPRSLTKSEISSVPNRVDVEFGDVVRLVGYEVTPKAVEPGDTVNVTLYWEPLTRTDQNYVVFVHLLSDVGTMIAQRDTYPGLGRYPTTTWDPGGTFADTYRVHLPDTAYAPDAGYVQVGLYLPGGARLTMPDGQDALRLASVAIQARPGEFPNPQEANFGDQIALLGYKLDRRVVEPGDSIQLTLYWQALVSMDTDYRGFAHVLGSENQIWANSDSLLRDEETPTSQWRAEQVVTEVRVLPVEPGTPPAFYDIEAGIYEPSGSRLPILAEGGHHLGSRILLSKIRVEEK